MRSFSKYLTFYYPAMIIVKFSYLSNIQLNVIAYGHNMSAFIAEYETLFSQIISQNLSCNIVALKNAIFCPSVLIRKVGNRIPTDMFVGECIHKLLIPDHHNFVRLILIKS